MVRHFGVSVKESAFRTSVLNKLPSWVHDQPMPATFMGASGTPDHYFDYHTDLWVEWKVMRQDNHMPARIPKESLPTEIQQRWLRRRFAAGGNVVVIVGIKLRARAYGFVLDRPEMWEGGLDRAAYEPLIVPSAELAAYITTRITNADLAPHQGRSLPAAQSGPGHHPGP